MNDTSSLLPTLAFSEFDIGTFLIFVLICGAICSLLGVFLRLICGKRSNINQSVSSAIGILMVYVVSIALLTIGSPYDTLIAPLPYLTFSGHNLSVLSLHSTEFPELCHQIIRMMLLAFLTNLLDTFIPRGKKFFSWFLFRCLSVTLAFLGHWLLNWAFTAFLPDFLLTYAPVLLLLLIALLLAVSVFKLVIGVLLGATLGPVVGAIYTFFFSNVVGKQIVKATVTSIILTAIVALLNHFGFTLICLSSQVLIAFLPAVLILVLIWYFLYKFL